MNLAIILGLALVASNYCTTGQRLPTVYEYFANATNLTGLHAGNQRFTLNGQELRIVSGDIHYYRVHPSLWRDRLRKLRASGANTVQTYIPWNLHEPHKDVYDFGDGHWDLSSFLDVRRYVRMAQEEDLLVLIRPGPYICSEWEYGGFPSWLQRFPNLTVRYNEPQYLERIRLFYNRLLPLFHDLQFTRGGPIIAFQIENEYGTYGQRSKEYLQFLKDLYDANGLQESLYFTSDNGFLGDGWQGGLPGVLMTANMGGEVDKFYTRLRELQPDMPVMTGEFWSGWFNFWGDDRQAGSTPEHFANTLEDMLRWNGSVDMLMFHGGTNFAFMGGGQPVGENGIKGVITSYDFDAPLTEAADYTEKYHRVRNLTEKYEVPKLFRPDMPAESRKVAYPTLQPTRYLTYEKLVAQVPASSKFRMERPVSMEQLPMNSDSGQSFGYIIYRKTLPINPGQNVVFKGSYPRDIAFLIVDGEQITGRDNAEDYWINSMREFPLSVTQAGNHTVDLMIEPICRINSGGPGEYVQEKGLAQVHNSKIELNGEEITNLEIIAMEFTNRWVQSLRDFEPVANSSALERTPVLLEATLNIQDEPADTWLDMRDWNKGVVFVNGFNVGRYWRIGPQKTLYVPAPLLKKGDNQILVFEQVKAHTEIVFADKPDLGTPPHY